MADPTQLGGWIERPASVTAFLATLERPLFAQAAPHLSGVGAGRTILLYKAFKDTLGEYLAYIAQKIGDCVGHGLAHGVDLLACVQITIGKRAEAFEETSSEAIYGMARVNIGGQRGSYSDGAVGAWAAQAVSKIGTVSRKVAGAYSGQRAKDWGAKGVPFEVQSEAGNHKVKTVALVSTYEELEDALANGYPVAVCSNQGFTLQRDRQGFCSPRGSWAHCMLFVGVRGGERPGACVFQSWCREMPSGPLDLDQPPNSFWADRSVVERMLAAGDSWALSNFDGYPGQVLPSRWTYAGFA